MAGLLIRELKLRGLAESILVVVPRTSHFAAAELNEKFDEKFIVLKGGDIRDQFGVNQWIEQKRVITSLDLAKRTEILPGLRQVHWDIVVVDEAHHMSAADESHKSMRYRLGELLRDSADHILMLTATPHKGDPQNFSLFLQLLDRDAYADVKSIRQAMERRYAPFYLRRTKEAMVYFPERQADGTWVARPIFTKRIPHTVDFHIEGAEFDLYREVTAFEAAERPCCCPGGRSARSGRGLLMALYQRRLASSTHAVRKSLENRAGRLERALTEAHDLIGDQPPDIPDPDELEEMEEEERERLERRLEAVTIARNADQIREEIDRLRELAQHALRVEDAGVEAKLSRLKQVLRTRASSSTPTSACCYSQVRTLWTISSRS
jgi:hypothetical protein